MQQSSSSIGALAAALAKAQVELVNPEKSMIATIPADDKGGTEQIFRYAPLVEWIRDSAQDLRPARDRHPTGNRDRSGRWSCQSYDHALPFERRMGGLDVAGLFNRRDGESQKNGRGAHLCAALCSFHISGYCRRR